MADIKKCLLSKLCYIKAAQITTRHSEYTLKMKLFTLLQVLFLAFLGALSSPAPKTLPVPKFIQITIDGGEGTGGGECKPPICRFT